MSKGNFKVRCIDNTDVETLYTKGKIYEIKDGKLVSDNGQNTLFGLNNFEQLNWRGNKNA